MRSRAGGAGFWAASRNAGFGIFGVLVRRPLQVERVVHSSGVSLRQRGSVWVCRVSAQDDSQILLGPPGELA